MILTKEDLMAIGQLIDEKIDRKIDPLQLKIDAIEKKVDLIGQYLNLTEIMENAKGVEIGLVHEIHKANK